MWIITFNQKRVSVSCLNYCKPSKDAHTVLKIAFQMVYSSILYHCTAMIRLLSLQPIHNHYRRVDHGFVSVYVNGFPLIQSSYQSTKPVSQELGGGDLILDYDAIGTQQQAGMMFGFNIWRRAFTDSEVGGLFKECVVISH